MTWARLDDDFWCNEKVLACPDAALGLYVRALSYAANRGTDGVISQHALRLLRARGTQVKALIARGLWDIDGENYRIHDYLKYNPSESEIKAKRIAKAMAGAKGAASRWHGGGNAPDPVPVPIPIIPPAPVRARDANSWYVQTTGRTPHNAAMVQILEDIDAAHPPECVEAVFKKSAAASEPWPYAKRIFDACLLSGHEPKVRGSDGASGQRIRAGAGRGSGRAPNLIDKWDAYLADHPDAGLPAAIDGVGSAAGDVAGDV